MRQILRGKKLELVPVPIVLQSSPSVKCWESRACLLILTSVIIYYFLLLNCNTATLQHFRFSFYCLFFFLFTLIGVLSGKAML